MKQKKKAPAPFAAYGAAGGEKKNPQKTSRPSADSGTMMRRWSREHQQ